MSFDVLELRKLSKLARMSLREDEMTEMGENLRKIIGFVDQLSEIDVNNVPPMAHAGDHGLELREDVVGPVLGRIAISSSAGYEDGLVRVPKIIE